MKRMIMASLALLCGMTLLSSCGEKAAETKDAAGSALTVAQLFADPTPYAEKEVTLTGTVTHVCKHGGKRLHITDTKTNERIKVESGEDMAAFARELEGSDIVVTGVLHETRIDKAYLDEWEQEVRDAAAAEAKEAKEAKKQSKKGAEQADAEHVAQGGNGGHVEPQGMDAVNEKRAELEKSGKPYLSQWHLVAKSYSMKDGSAAPVAKDVPAEEGHEGHQH
ncbi:MAG TPA: hypothetical protein PK916_03930 [Bacteroidota bacterium]|nr:hypothetical protein [Bacteroidota bacterium]